MTSDGEEVTSNGTGMASDGAEVTSNGTGMTTNGAEVTSNGTERVVPATLGGTVDVADFILPAGQTTTVTSDLSINATGNVIIDGDLIADQNPSGPGYDISITAEGEIEINGLVQAGAPAQSSALTGKRIACAQQATITGVEESTSDSAGGEDGGPLRIVSVNGNITIGRNASLVGMDGDDGRPGFRGGDGGPVAGVPGAGGEEYAKFGADGSTYAPGEIVVEGIKFRGQAEGGLAGVSNEYFGPDFCADIDYECPWGLLCGS